MMRLVNESDQGPNDLQTPESGGLRIDRGFFSQDTVAVARRLLGQLLVRRLADGTRLSGLIVEVEAYLGPEDRAAHTFGNRRTPRNESMWQRGGMAYVYFTYGLHHCFNVVTRDAQHPQAVLVRALQPVEGIQQMAERRPAARRVTDLCSGPAKLCQALQIDRELDGSDLVSGDSLFLERVQRRALPGARIAAGPRIGIDYAGDWVDVPLRFMVRSSRFASR